MKYSRGAKILERFQVGYKVAGEMIERFGVNRMIMAGLIEVYLDEVGESYNYELRQNKDILGPYVKDTKAPHLELNEQGDAIVRAFIFAYRNRLDKVINVRRTNNESDK